MTKSRETLRAYLIEAFETAGVAPTPETMDILLIHIQLQEGASNEEEEERGHVLIEENHHGELSAKHVSLYNLINVSWYDIFGFGLSAAPIMIMPANTAYQIAYACVKLIYDFYPKLTYEFKKEKDAKILGSIALLGKEKFTLKEVKESLKENFKEELAGDYFSRAIAFFRKKAILRYIGNDYYQLEEEMSYERS